MPRTAAPLTALLTAALLLALPGPAAAQDGLTLIINEVTAQPIPGEAAYTVTAYVTAADSAGQPVAGLDAGDFAVSQDGQAVRLESAALAERPAAIVLVVDISGSMAAEGKMAAAREAAARFVDALKEGDRIAIVYFNDEVVVAQDFSEDHQAAATILSLLEAVPDSGTCLYDAAATGITLATGAPPGQRAIVLLTDGIDELPDQSGPCSDHTSTEVIALAGAGAAHVPIYTIGVGNRVNADDLATIAASTGGDARLAPTAAEVAALFDALAAQLRNQMALTYRAEIPSGEHTLTATVTHDGATAVATRAFLAPELPPLLSLSGLDDGALLAGQRVVRATVSGGAGVARVTFLLDGQELIADSEAPFEVTLDGAALAPGDHRLAAQAALADGSTLEKALQFTVSAAPAAAESEPGAQEAAPEPAGAAPRGSLVPVWIGLGAAALIVLLGVAARRRRPAARNGRARAARPAPANALTIDEAGAFATLTVEESLSLERGHFFTLSGDTIRIGRGEDNDVVVPDAPVSRHQAEIRRAGTAFQVYDLGSRYGTFVGGRQVGERGQPLLDGDLLQLGTRTSLRFTLIAPAGRPQDLTFDAGADDRPATAADATLLAGGATLPVDQTIVRQEETRQDSPTDQDDGGTVRVDPPGPGRP